MHESKRFWKKVRRSEQGCWNWIAGKTTAGYGCFSIAGGNIYAHRFSWGLHRGPIPEGMFVCHHCDNTSCVRPDHLFLGTSKDNVDDAMKKGRFTAQPETLRRLWREKWNVSRRGEANPDHRLTEVLVRKIRATYQKNVFGYKRLCQTFGISHGLAQRIVSGKAWPHLWK